MISSGAGPKTFDDPARLGAALIKRLPFAFYLGLPAQPVRRIAIC
jgi:hypothetical protein